MYRIATRLVLVVTVVGVAVAKVGAQQAPSAVGQNLHPDATGDEAAINAAVPGTKTTYSRWPQMESVPYLGAIESG